MAIGQSGAAARLAAARAEAVRIGLRSPWDDAPIDDRLAYAVLGALLPTIAPATVQGGAGNDRLEVGGPGTGTINGGAGIDTAIFRFDRDWSVGKQFDARGLSGGADLWLDSGSGKSRRLTGIENLEVHGRVDGPLPDNFISGGAGADLIYGGPGDDILSGGPGSDTLNGFEGDDVYTIDNLFDRVVEQPGGGYDTVFASVPFTLPSNVEALYLQGSVASGTGNALGNLLVGDAGANLLRGLAGMDTLYGYGGNDRLDGGPGSDRLFGGAGVNSAVYHLDTDWAPGRAFDGSAIGPSGGTVTIDGGAGNVDTLTDIQRLEITGFADAPNTILGSAGADVIRGGAMDDYIDGGPGGDAMGGGPGNDTYIVDNPVDQIVERTGEGYDSIYASVTYTLAPNVEALTLVGFAYAATGNESDNLLTGTDRGNRLRGGGGDDTLYGLAGNDLLQGGTGNDRLYGGDGVDTLDGGPGADWLTGGADADIFLLRKGEAAGDTIVDFTTGEDKAQLTGWSAGTTLVQTDAAAHAWTITDGVDGMTNVLTILGDVRAGDVIFG